MHLALVIWYDIGFSDRYRTETGIAPMQRELLEEDEGEEAYINSKNMPYK